jgi:hypothetical protein
MEVLHGEYALAIAMIAKKDVHGNYTDRWMVEATILSIDRLSSISMPCLHVRRSLMLWDMQGFSLHLIFRQGTISCRFDKRTRPRLHFGASTFTTRIIYISGSFYLLG